MTKKEMLKAIEWWESLPANEGYEIVKTALCDFTNGFCEIFWEHEGVKGRDRIRKHGREHILEVIE